MWGRGSPSILPRVIREIARFPRRRSLLREFEATIFRLSDVATRASTRATRKSEETVRVPSFPPWGPRSTFLVLYCFDCKVI